MFHPVTLALLSRDDSRARTRDAQRRINAAGVYARVVAREQNELLASLDRFYFGYFIGLYGSTSVYSYDPRYRAFCARYTALARLQRGDIGAAAPDRAPLSNPRWSIFVRCDTVAGDSNATVSGEVGFHGSDVRLPRGRSPIYRVRVATRVGKQDSNVTKDADTTRTRAKWSTRVVSWQRWVYIRATFRNVTHIADTADATQGLFKILQKYSRSNK